MAKRLVLLDFRLTGMVSTDVGEVMPCGAANTHPALKNRRGDGMRLMGELALTTGARVVASNVTQYFHAIPGLAQSLFNAGSRNDWRIDFGEWEGDVFEFSPDDGMGRRLSRGAHPRFDF